MNEATDGMSQATDGTRRIGVYVCHCGGNISDYVDIDRVIAAVEHEPGVVVARQQMFACSDASQQEMQADIETLGLDGLVVASCSPKLHVTTFRGVAKRAGLNPFEYSQVNIREQASWIHTDDAAGTTDKAIGLVRAGIARTRLSEPLEPIVVETTQKTLVIGGGVSGMRAAIGLADIGLGVFLVEREPALGGHVVQLGKMYPHGLDGRVLAVAMIAEITRRPQITVFTGAEVISKAGSFGNYRVGIRVGGLGGETLTVEVGSIVVATGFDTYKPDVGEYGYGIDGVVTLPEFKELLDQSSGPLTYLGRRVRDVAYIYCVGSREPAEVPDGNAYCSRYCCAATVAASIQLSERDAGVHQYHLYRDMRTFGRYELMYTESRKLGSVYMKFDPDAPPEVARGDDGRLRVTVRDVLTAPEPLAVPVDLVVLVTGMVARDNDALTNTLKLPLGRDGFYNEIHPKLRPVETTVDGVYICGACQGPRNSAESVASGLAAVTQSAVILKKGYAELDPLVAIVHADACSGCGECVAACPYTAIEMDGAGIDGRAGRPLAIISETTCKGCGGCVPLCPDNAIDLRGYTDAQLTAMIDSLTEVSVA
ncbi:MAG TPA: CoB--CoM heterodisulfide reductase iron-sulfur subunit A family protein [Candidatus Limnocylindrales bacterium]|nr:CoB--CoM heterodisulfide reductase iron-sulfur subunit A family protein [Candidatus Limnocylindrales bacterium]